MFSYNKVFVTLLALIFVSSAYSSDIRYGVRKAPVGSAEATADALMKSELDVGSDLDVGAALARAEAAQRKSRESFRFKEEAPAKPHHTIVKAAASPKMAMPRVAAAHEPVRSSIFAPQPHSLFSWARSSVEPAVKQQQRVQGVESRHSKHAGLKKPTLQHHKASAKAQRNHRGRTRRWPR